MEIIKVFINNCVNYLQSVGLIGGFLLILLESIIPVFPLAIFIGINIVSFGNIMGFIISYFATIVGCVLSFCLFRFGFKNLFLRILNNKTITKIEKFMKYISNIDFNLLVILLALPFTPAFAINIAAGLSNIKAKKFFMALLIGKLSIILFWGYVGSNLIQGFTDKIVILKLIILVLGAYILSKIVEKIIKLEE